MKSKFVYLTIITSLITCVLFGVLMKEKPTKTPIQPWLDEIENGIWQEFEKYDVSKERCMALKQQDYDQFLAVSKRPYQKPVSATTRATIDPILKEFGLNPADIPVIQWDRHIAAAQDQLIYLNEPEFLSLSQEVQKFAIAHEIQHLIYQDHSTIFFLYALLGNPNEKFLDYNHPYLKYRRFTELRADAMVGATNKTWQQRYELYAQEMLNLLDNNPNDLFYPSNENRLLLARNITNPQALNII